MSFDAQTRSTHDVDRVWDKVDVSHNGSVAVSETRYRLGHRIDERRRIVCGRLVGGEDNLALHVNCALTSTVTDKG